MCGKRLCILEFYFLLNYFVFYSRLVFNGLRFQKALILQPNLLVSLHPSPPLKQAQAQTHSGMYPYEPVRLPCPSPPPDITESSGPIPVAVVLQLPSPLWWPMDKDLLSSAAISWLVPFTSIKLMGSENPLGHHYLETFFFSVTFSQGMLLASSRM